VRKVGEVLVQPSDRSGRFDFVAAFRLSRSAFARAVLDASFGATLP
jgi:hypothetical protein